MNLCKNSKILKIYISEDSMYKGHNLYHALVRKFMEVGMAGVTVSRGIEGCGQDMKLHTTRALELSSSLPIIIDVVDIPERIEKVLPLVCEMVNEGLVLVTDVTVIKCGKEKFDTANDDK
ncbi:MAG: DUF190 domain-containing protein [Caulobacteraceae bacterium]